MHEISQIPKGFRSTPDKVGLCGITKAKLAGTWYIAVTFAFSAGTARKSRSREGDNLSRAHRRVQPKPGSIT